MTEKGLRIGRAALVNVCHSDHKDAREKHYAGRARLLGPILEAESDRQGLKVREGF